eukprot:scpid12221/ scgid12183/ 
MMHGEKVTGKHCLRRHLCEQRGEKPTPHQRYAQPVAGGVFESLKRGLNPSRSVSDNADRTELCSDEPLLIIDPPTTSVASCSIEFAYIQHLGRRTWRTVTVIYHYTV